MYTNLLLTLLLIAWQSSYMNLCFSGMLEQLSLLTWSSTDFVGILWCNWGVLLVAVTAFLCKLVSWVSLNIIQSPWSNTEVGTTACGQKWFRFRHLPYIFHINHLFSLISHEVIVWPIFMKFSPLKTELIRVYLNIFM